MRSEFTEVLLSDLGTLDRGKSRHRPRYAEHLYGGPYPFIQTGDIKAAGGRVRTFAQTYSEAGLAQSRLWPAGTLCITIAANIAETALLTFPACFPDSIVGFIANKDRCDVRYIEYWFRAFRETVQQRSYGTVQENINLEVLRGIKLALPSLATQRLVADSLDQLDDRIDLLRQTNATLESIAQTLFKSWFIDFDPVRAKAEGREPDGMDAAMSALFPAKLEESALGLIPKGWAVTSLAQCCEVQIGGVWGEEAQTDRASIEVACLRGIDAVDLAKGDLPRPPVRWVTQKQIESRRLREGDILVEGSGSFCGRSLLWAGGYEILVPLTVTYSNFVKRLSSPAGLPYARWVQRHLDFVYQSGEVTNYRTGSAFPNLDLAGMLNVTRILPPEELLMRFDALMRTFEAQKVVRIRHAATLCDLRDSLLPRLISGKLRLPEAQEQVEDALG